MAAPRCVVLAGLVLVLAQAGLAVTAQPHQHLADGPTAAATTEAGAVRTVLPGAPADACVTAPTMANCSHYMYPQTAAAADLRQLCHAMPFMGACSVALACNASGASPDIDPKAPGAANVSRNIPNVCDPFQLATTVCRLDTGMSKMGGCNNINTMCVQGSQVPSCKTKGLTILPPTAKLNAQVRSICEEMTMDGCEKCMPSWEAGKTWADCNLLEVYSYLCYQMPEMTQCPEWHAMCKADPSLVFCYPSPDAGGGGGSGGGGGGDSPSGPATPGPVMKMYFFNEMPFYLLFKSWTPRTTPQLAAAWLAIFALGLLYELLQAAYGIREAAFWARRAGAHTAAMAAAAAAASQRGMDEELGGPLAEGVMDSSTDEDGGASDVRIGGGGSGPSCCSGSGPHQQLPVASVVVGRSGGSSASPLSKRPCCGGAGAGALALQRQQQRPGGSFHSSGSSSKQAAPQYGGGAPGACCKPRRASCCGAWLDPELVAMDLIRGVARFVLAGLAYLLMLAAMSFNVAIFFAVIAGVAVGSMLFGRWRWSAGTAEGYSHCGCGSS